MTISEDHTNASASCSTNSTSVNRIRFYRGSSLPPELLHAIMVNLPPESLVQCAQASRNLNRIAAALIWSSHVDLQTRRRILGPQYRLSLVNNAHQIRCFTIHSECTLDFFCPNELTEKDDSPQQSPPIVFPHLQKLEFAVSFRRNNRDSRPKFTRVLSWIEKKFSSLQILHIENVIPADLATTVAHSRQLQLTDILLKTVLSVSEATFFFSQLPPQVQSLNLETISGFRRGGPPAEKSPFTTDHHALRALILNTTSCDSKVFDRFLVPFLATCSSNLKSFHAGNPKPLRNVNVQVALKNLGIQAGETFTYWDLNNKEAADEEIANKIRVFTRLEMVMISNLANVGPRTIETILALPEILRVLELPNYAFITSAHVVLMLSSLKCLESFAVHGESSTLRPDSLDGDVFAPPCTLFLSATDVLSIDWATRSLSVFSCPIQVPRLARHVPKEHRMADLTCNDQGECWATQKQVLRRLAEQTNLTCLDFSIDIRGSSQWYSLEMTRDSGLEELEKLTKLEKLWISDLNHSMDRLDLRWVAEMWTEPQFNFRRR